MKKRFKSHYQSIILIVIIVLVFVLLNSMAFAVTPNANTHEIVVSDEAVVMTESGKVQGLIDNGSYVYLGVPYAKAERFMMPEEVAPWDGVRDATKYGESCPIPPMDKVAGDELFNPHRYLPMNEDCHFLNIWTQGVNDGKKRPVMVWLHGGGHTNGSAIEQKAYDGTNLSKKGDVVVVTLNHRLNVLGYLDLSAYGDKYKYSGNAGTADMVAALKWIKANIARFGGDSDNITIFGQSGGGGKVLTLMNTPAAEGLFKKAIVQSYGVGPKPQEFSRQIAELTLDNLGITSGKVDQIQTVPYQELLDAAEKATDQVNKGGWAPIVDGDYLPVDPTTVFTEQARDIPMLVGNVLNEFNTVIRNSPMELLADNKNSWTPAETKAKLVEKYGDKANAVAEAFLNAYPGKKLADAYFVDTRFRPNTINVQRLKAEQSGAPVYSYMFTYESPVMDGIAMAYHCAEIPYIFNNVELAKTATGGGDDAFVMADKMSSAWINFAYYGDPNYDGLPYWPAYTNDTGATMILDNNSVVRNKPDRELMEFLVPDLQY